MTSKKARDAQATPEANLMGALADLVHAAQVKKEQEYWKHTDTPIEYQGKKIILPGDPSKMSTKDAIAALEQKEADENQEVDVFEIIDAFPLDGAVAFVKALRALYGWASPVPTPGFFGPQNPKMLTVQISLTESIQVPWGQFQVPGIENPIGVDATGTDSGPAFVIHGTVRKREQEVIKQIAELTRDILKNESIYRGSAVRLKVDRQGRLKFDLAPEFIDTSSAKPDELIMNRDIEEQIETSVLTPIKNTQACVKHGIPLNRGVLFEGPYGTGKTMTAMVTAKTCEDNNWTFILLDNVKGLKEALLFAQRYQPAVVFAEDIDRIANERSESGNDLLNTIDGALTKSSRVITCLTTNYVEKIHNAMLRPGRLDAVISVTPPDGEAVGRLIQLYARDLLAEGETFDVVGEILKGQIPATVREVVERSKLAMISRGGKFIKEEDLVIAATGMARHLELLNGKEEEEPSPQEALGIAFENLINGGNIAETLGEAQSIIVEEIEDSTNAIRSDIGDVENVTKVAAKNSKKVAGQVEEIHQEIV